MIKSSGPSIIDLCINPKYLPTLNKVLQVRKINQLARLDERRIDEGMSDEDYLARKAKINKIKVEQLIDRAIKLFALSERKTQLVFEQRKELKIAIKQIEDDIK